MNNILINLIDIEELKKQLYIQISNNVGENILASEKERKHNMKTINAEEELRTLLNDQEVRDTLIELSDK